MGFKTEYAVACIIIAIIVSVVGGYFYGQSPITGYKKEINSLEIKNLELSDQQEQLQVELTSLQDQLDNTTAILNATRSFLEDLQAQIEEMNEQIKDLEIVNARAIQELEQELEEKQKRIEEIEQELKQLKDIKRVAIIVEESIGQKIQTNLNRYTTEIEALYYNVRITQYMGDWKTHAELRAFIQSLYYNSTIDGAILMGNLPYALWEYSPAGIPDIGPLPFYYEDMDGTFEDKDADGIFDHYVWGENEGPEIWVSWMRPDSDNVTRSLNDYLEKLHNYYSGNISYQNKALVVITKDWEGWTSEVGLSLGKIYPEVTSIGGLSTEVTASQYLNEYINWYEITDVWSHGDSNDQEFDQGTNLFGEEVKSLSGGSKLTIIWACHAADFHKTPINNLAASYVFDNNFGLATIAATRSIGIEKHEIVFQSLNEGYILGEAFFDWINIVYDKSFIQDRFQLEILEGETEIDRFMWGFILMGDPFIQLNKYQQIAGCSEIAESKVLVEEDYGDAPLGEIGGLHYVYWDFGRDTFQSLNITIRIYDEPSLQDGLYFQMYQGIINDVGFYFGIQTDVFRPNVGSTGKGLIFSRWETRNLSNARPADDGWTESAGYEGNFIGIRKNYEWTTHTYRLRITKVDTDDVGDWYGVWINDLDTGDVDYLGSIRFPRVESERSGIKNHGISWTELYYKKNGQTPIPSWHISIKEITVDEGKPPLHATSNYSTIQNTDIYYDEEEGEIHFLMGYDVERDHSAGLLY